MKNFKLTYILIITLSILNSCTIQKRIYRPGYHITWKSNNNKIDHTTITEKNTEFARNEDTVLTVHIDTVKKSETALILNETENFLNFSYKGQSIKSIKKQLNENLNKTKIEFEKSQKKKTLTKSPLKDPEERNYNLNAIIGFIAGCVSLILLVFAALISFNAIFDDATAPQFLLVLFLAMIVTAILSLIFSQIGRREIKEKYSKGRVFANVGTILGIISLGIPVVLAIILLIFFLFFYILFDGF